MQKKFKEINALEFQKILFKRTDTNILLQMLLPPEF